MLKRVFPKETRALVAELVRTDFKLRYQNSVLGYLWSLLRPLLLFLILDIVFVKFLKVGNGIPHYPVYLLFGLVMWNFFGEMTMQSLGSIVGRGDLIRKISIPRWTIVFSSSLSALINFGLTLIVFAIFMAAGHIAPTLSLLWLPFLFLEIYIFALGVSFFLSTAFVKYRDISYIWEVGLQAGFYITPVLYPLSRLPSVFLQKLILLNPLSQAMQQARYEAITKQSATVHMVFHNEWYQYLPYLIVLIVFGIGALYFKVQSKYFAENI